MLLLFSGLMYSACASSIKNVSFNGVGVAIDLTFPEESYPNITITHDVTITANTNLKLRNFTLFVYAPINSVLQYITNDTVAWPSMQENESLPVVNILIWLPENVNGRLYCLMYVETEINLVIKRSSCTFYTTLVSEPTFSEMQSEYDVLWEDYILLDAKYKALDENFTILWANYTLLLSELDQLKADYNSKVVAYETLLAQYNKLSDDYDALDANYGSKIAEFGALQTDYGDLNSTCYSLQTSYNALSAVYAALNQTYTILQTEFDTLQERINVSESALNTDRIVLFIFVVTVAALIAFVVYLKRKKEEPYVVIRKETVSMKSEED
jgi:predicted nuclease with TOPRIM domain